MYPSISGSDNFLTDKFMLKIENASTHKLSKKLGDYSLTLLRFIPREHLRGIEKLRIVDSIVDPRVKNFIVGSRLPGLYHPRQGTQSAWLEVAINTLLPSDTPFYKRLIPRLSLKDNIAAVLYSLIGQHYYVTFKHSVKRSQIETLVRSYTEKYMKLRNERDKKLRTRLFKPLQPTLEKWARQMQRRTKNISNK